MENFNNDSLLAYKKAYYHSLKYITEDVFGILVGIVKGDDKIVLDSFPLSHTRILAPTLEIALEIIESNLPKDHQIIGLYSAYLDMNKITAATDIENLILSKISENSQTLPLLMKIAEAREQEQNIDEGQEEEDKSTLSSSKQLYVTQKKNSDEFTLKKLHGIEVGNVYFNKMKEDISAGQYRKIVDFDSHFEDITMDYTNSFLK